MVIGCQSIWDSGLIINETRLIFAIKVTMKKLFVMLFCGLLGLGCLAGCNTKSDNDNLSDGEKLTLLDAKIKKSPKEAEQY